MNNECLFDEIISTYTRAQAIEDGVLIDASGTGETAALLREISRSHFKYPIAMTEAVFELIQQAVDHPKHCNDWKGVWHDILWMAKVDSTRQEIDPTTVVFTVIITGVGRSRYKRLKFVCGPNDDGSPCLTLMLPSES